MFFKNGKLLIDKPRKRPTFQMIGGSVEKGELTTSDEIEEFMWFGVTDDKEILSNTLKNKIIPYALEHELIY